MIAEDVKMVVLVGVQSMESMVTCVSVQTSGLDLSVNNNHTICVIDQIYVLMEVRVKLMSTMVAASVHQVGTTKRYFNYTSNFVAVFYPI